MENHYKLKSAHGFFLRWRQQEDIQDLLEIDMFSSENLWTRGDFECILRNCRVNCFVASNVHTVPIGFLIYEKMEASLFIHNLAIHPEYCRLGIGTLLLNKLKSKLNQHRSAIVFHVRDTNLAGHLFLQANGFKAIKVIRNYFKDFYGENEELEETDSYVFSFKKG